MLQISMSTTKIFQFIIISMQCLDYFIYIINKFQICLKLLNEYNVQTYFHIRTLTKHKYNVQILKNALYVFVHHQFEKHNAPPIKVLKPIS